MRIVGGKEEQEGEGGVGSGRSSRNGKKEQGVVRRERGVGTGMWSGEKKEEKRVGVGGGNRSMEWKEQQEGEGAVVRHREPGP